MQKKNERKGEKSSGVTQLWSACLFSTLKALASNSSPAKKNKKSTNMRSTGF